MNGSVALFSWLLSGNLVFYGGLFVVALVMGVLAERFARRSLLGSAIAGTAVTTLLMYGYIRLVFALHPEFSSSGRWAAAVIMSFVAAATAVLGTLLLRRYEYSPLRRASIAAVAGIVMLFVAYFLLDAFVPTVLGTM